MIKRTQSVSVETEVSAPAGLPQQTSQRFLKHYRCLGRFPGPSRLDVLSIDTLFLPKCVCLLKRYGLSFRH